MDMHISFSASFFSNKVYIVQLPLTEMI